MTPMTLGAVYLGGAYFFLRASRAAAWHTVKAGFVAVGTFASLMGAATFLHWDRLNHEGWACSPTAVGARPRSWCRCRSSCCR